MDAQPSIQTDRGIAHGLPECQKGLIGSGWRRKPDKRRTINTSCWLYPLELKVLQTVAEMDGLSVSELLRRLIRAYIKQRLG